MKTIIKYKFTIDGHIGSAFFMINTTEINLNKGLSGSIKPISIINNEVFIEVELGGDPRTEWKLEIEVGKLNENGALDGFYKKIENSPIIRQLDGTSDYYSEIHKIKK